MRVNVRSTDVAIADVDLVEKEADGIKYVGVRFSFDEEADPEHAVTLWQVDDLRSKAISKLLTRGVELLTKRTEGIAKKKAKAKVAKAA